MITFRERAFDYVQKLFLFTFHLVHLSSVRSLSDTHRSNHVCTTSTFSHEFCSFFVVVVDVFIPHSIRCSAHFSRKAILFSYAELAMLRRDIAQRCPPLLNSNVFFSLLFIAFSSLTFAVLIQSIASRWSCKRRAELFWHKFIKFELSVFVIGKLFIATE